MTFKKGICINKPNLSRNSLQNRFFIAFFEVMKGVFFDGLFKMHLKELPAKTISMEV